MSSQQCSRAAEQSDLSVTVMVRNFMEHDASSITFSRELLPDSDLMVIDLNQEY